MTIPTSSHSAAPSADTANQAHVFPASGYAGDISPQTAWQWVQSGQAVLVDVRTQAELAWVGFVPGSVGVEWASWPSMQPNPVFDEQLHATLAKVSGAAPDPVPPKLVMLCRSGARSVGAARRAAELGFEAYNILEGFEGNPDAHRQRGHVSGWRFHGLPWVQG